MGWRRGALVAVVVASLLGAPNPSNAGHPPLQEGAERIRPSTVTLNASPVTTLDGVSGVWLHLGETVTLSGAVRRAAVGSKVRLQQRTPSGWRTLRRATLPSRTYEFTEQPDVGVHRFRVVKLKRPGERRAVSTTRKVTVLPVPTLSVQSHTAIDDNGVSVLVLSGSVAGPSEPTVVLQRRSGSDGAWEVWSGVDPVLTPSDGMFEFQVRGPAQQQFRVVVPASDHWSEADSTVFANAREPYRLELNDSVSLHGLYNEPHSATVLIDLTAGQEVTIATRCNVPVNASVIAPSGASLGPLDGSGSRHYLRFTAEETGTYTIDFSEGDDIFVYASSTKELTTSLDAPAISSNADFPDQVVDVHFHASAGQAFTIEKQRLEGCAVLAPDGSEVGIWIGHPDVYRRTIYRATTDGDFTLHCVDTTDDHRLASVVSLIAVTQLDHAADGSSFDADIDIPGRVVVVTADCPDDTMLWTAPTGDNTKVETLDALTREATSTRQGGPVLLVVSARNGWTGSQALQLASPFAASGAVDGEPTPIDESGYAVRYGYLTFHGSAGQIVTPQFTASAGSAAADKLRGPDGVTIRDILWPPHLWKLPADGDYVLGFATSDGFVGSVSLTTVDPVVVPADGTPTTVAIHPQLGFALARVPTAFADHVAVTLDEISGLGTGWELYLTADDEDWFARWTTPAQGVFGWNSASDLYGILSAPPGVTGSVRLTVSTSTP